MKERKRKLTCYLLWATFAVLIGFALLLLILGLTVFKPKHPITTVNSITIDDLYSKVDLLPFRIHLNVTLDTNVTVYNPNRVGFRYTNSTACLRYRGNDVGEVAIPAGKIGARSKDNLSLGLTLLADRLILDSHLFSDVVSGKLGFTVHVRLPGKVRVVFDVHVVAYADCDVEIHLMSRSLVNQSCRYRTKL